MIGMGMGMERERERDRDRDGERVILINPFNHTIIVQGGGSGSGNRGRLGDYFIGPGLEMLMQHLSENDPNRYGTPPATKEAVEALQTVKIEETMELQCAVCLDECDVGDEVKEMPCKHKFHQSCIVAWLELHSTCPVCRFQLPADESKLVANTAPAAGNAPLLWPFTAFFSPLISQPTAGNSGSSTDAPPADDNST